MSLVRRSYFALTWIFQGVHPGTPTTMQVRMPNRPLEMQVDEGEQRTFTCYTAPGASFASEEEMKDHYRSEWHRYNLKRKVAGLAPLSREAFEERSAREGEREAALQQKGGTRKQAREDRRVAKAEAQSKNTQSKAAGFVATAEMTADQYMQYKMDNAATFDEGSDLFSTHRSAGLHENLAHMARTHGFYVPHLDYCVDMPGLVQYLQEKVYVGNVSLVNNKAFHSLEAVQSHMRDKGLCRLELEGHEEELGEFYDMDSLAEGSPLWEVEEVEEDWEDVDEDEEGEGEGGESSAEGEAAPSWLLPGGAVDFDTLFERAVKLGVVSEAEMDQMTDQVASGGSSEAQLIAAWRAPVLAAEAQRKARTRAFQDTASVSTVSRVVRYTGMPAADDAVSLSLKGREIGHRTLRRFYRQSFKAHSTAAPPKCPLARARLRLLRLRRAGRAWRLWAARHAPGDSPGHWAPGHRLGRLSEPTPKSPTPPHLAMQAPPWALPTPSCKPSWSSTRRRACSPRMCPAWGPARGSATR